jgi:hypothetical protein
LEWLGKFCAHLLFDIAIVGKVEDGGYEAEIKLRSRDLTPNSNLSEATTQFLGDPTLPSFTFI